MSEAWEALPVPHVKKTPLSQRRQRQLPALNVTLARPDDSSTRTLDFGDAPSPSPFTAAFELGVALGSGTVAVVRLGTRRSDHRQFAVKIASSDDTEMRQFTRDEYEIVHSLSHPAIIRFEAIYETPSKIFICMDYCEDGNVQSYVEQHGAMTEGAVQSLGSQLLRGVNCLHRKRVVHRDLKPENLLLQKGATVLKITDFNSAKRIGAGDGSSLMLTDRGTPLYRAPELRFGRLWNERVDIWASGLCLYFMLRNALPFDAQKAEVRETLAKGKLPSVDWDGITDSMQSLVKLCLTVDMQDRPLAMELLLHRVFRMTSDPATSNHLESWVRLPASEASEQGDSRRADIIIARMAHPEPFALHKRFGLVAMPAGARRSLGSPESNKSCFSPFSAGSDAQSGTSCYILGPTSGTPDADESPIKMLRSQQAKHHESYASWKAPRHFDALLQLAESKDVSSHAKRGRADTAPLI